MGEVVEKSVRIKYNYLPKYCKSCKIQGHDEEQCYVLHPELYPKKQKEEDKTADEKKNEKDKTLPLQQKDQVQAVEKNTKKEDPKAPKG